MGEQSDNEHLLRYFNSTACRPLLTNLLAISPTYSILLYFHYSSSSSREFSVRYPGRTPPVVPLLQ